MAKDKVPAAIAAASRTVDLPEPLMPAMTVRFELKLTSMSEKHLKLWSFKVFRNIGISSWIIGPFHPNSIINLSLPFPPTDDKIDIRKGGRQSFTETCGEDSKREKDT